MIKSVVLTITSMLFILLSLSSAHALERVSVTKASAEANGDLLFEGDQKVFSITGEYKNLGLYYSTKRFWDTTKNEFRRKVLLSDLNRLRLSPEWRIGEQVLVHVEVGNELIFSNYHKTSTFDLLWRPSTYNDLTDGSLEYDKSDHYYYGLKLHRGYAKITTDRFTITAGRQLVRFGSGKLWNPLDIMNPVSPLLIEGAEEVKGVDALRVEYYPKGSTEISLVYAPKRKYDELRSRYLWGHDSSFIGRVKTVVGDTDLAFLGGLLPERFIGGADVATVFFDGILRGSILYSRPDDYDAFVTAGAGYEYSFSGGINFLIEYFYNGNSLNNNQTLMNAYLQTSILGMDEMRYEILANQFLTFNRHYLGVALGYDVTPLVHGDLLTIGDLEGQAVFCLPSLRYNMEENIDLTLSAMWGFTVGSPSSSKVSEFKDYKRPLLMLGLKYYF